MSTIVTCGSERVKREVLLYHFAFQNFLSLCFDSCMVSSTDYHLILLPVELYAASVQITPGMCGNFADKKNGIFVTSNLFRET